MLVFVAAGLLTTSLHTAHEAGWFNGLQQQALNLDGFVEPGTVHGALLTGMLGLQPQPTVGETIVWLAYALPMCLYVAWPDRWRWRRRPIRGCPRPQPAAPRRSFDQLCRACARPDLRASRRPRLARNPLASSSTVLLAGALKPPAVCGA